VVVKSVHYNAVTMQMDIGELDIFPELGWPFGYPLAIVIMIVSVAVLRRHFRRIGWL